MQRDPLQVAHRWREQAEADLRYAHTNLSAKHYALVCFLSQQAAEKAIKAILHWRAGDFPRTHLIADLVEELRAHDPQLAERLREAPALDAFYQSTRYPDALDDAVPDRSFYDREARLALDRAQDVMALVVAELP
ncbi:MAG: HEPN domain-containing protein [Vulcanimicrobiaceae bacterium]